MSSNLFKHLWRSKVLFRILGENQHALSFCSKSVPSAMKAWCYDNYDEDSIPSLDEMEVPSRLGPTEVLVQIKAASLNPFDSLMRTGFGSVFLNGLRRWNKANEFPLVLGRDFSGVVVKTGRMVTRVKESDEVWGTPAIWRPGTFAEYCCMGQDELTLKPKPLSHVEAASFPYVLCTAWSALCDSGGLTERNARDKRVFIVGGSGGLGTVAIQLMKAWGAHVTSTCSSDAVELLEKIGTDDIIDYKNEDVAKRIREEPRYDVILDTLGGNLDLFSGSRSCSRSIYILLAPPMLDHIDRSGLLLGSLRSGGEFFASSVFQRLSSNIDYQWAFFKSNTHALNHLTKIISEGKVVPVIDGVFDFSELPKAFEKLDNGHLRGKVVLNLETT